MVLPLLDSIFTKGGSCGVRISYVSRYKIIFVLKNEEVGVNAYK